MKRNVKSIIPPVVSYLRKPWVLFILFSLIGAVIFYLRFPNNFLEPNFYAEDGSTFFATIRHSGLLTALFTPFNGYFIFGVYLLEGLGMAVNFLLFHNTILDNARSFALVSYLFFGMCAALPFLLFKSRFTFVSLCLVFILTVFVPLPGSDYAILGTIGNTKFIYVYVAFLLILYRHYLPEQKLTSFIAADAALLLCAYTNVTVYVLMPFALIRYVSFVRPKQWKSLFRKKSFLSLIALGVLLLPQIVMIKIFGIPKLPGYLDTPYAASSTINLFLYRPFIFPFVNPFKIVMSNVVAVALFLILSAFLWASLRRYQIIGIFAYFSILITTLLFVFNRTGVSEFFLHYNGSGPDQFFYTQNMIIVFAGGIAIGMLLTLIKNVPARVFGYAVVVVFAIVYAQHAGTYGHNDFMQRTVKNIYVNAQHSCTISGSNVNIQLYPIISDTFQLKNLKRADICTGDLAHYVPATEYLALTPQNNDYLPDINKVTFTQTIHADYNGFDGIDILFLTYQQRLHGTYQFHLYSSDCRTPILAKSFEASGVQDAQYYSIYFNKIANAKDRNFCFTITGPTKYAVPLALPLSQNDQYPIGTLTVNKQAKKEDLILQLHYTK